MPFKGLDKHRARLKRLAGPEMEQAIEKALMRTADAVQQEARESIGRGSVSGTPSKPGSPPNVVTGKLRDQIKVTKPAKLTAHITSHAEYSRVQEFGSSTHPSRPFMRPARDKTLPKMHDFAVEEVAKAVKKSGRS